MADVRFKNAAKTKDVKACPCGAWLTHWMQAPIMTRLMRDALHREPIQCANAGCDKDAEDGGHVCAQRKAVTNWLPEADGPFIVPLCSGCNNASNTDWMDLRVEYELVQARPAKWCGTGSTPRR